MSQKKFCNICFKLRLWGDSKQSQPQLTCTPLPCPSYPTLRPSPPPPSWPTPQWPLSPVLALFQSEENDDAFSSCRAGTSGWSCCPRFGSGWSPDCCCCRSWGLPIILIFFARCFVLTWLLLLLFALMLLLMFNTETYKVDQWPKIVLSAIG